MRNSNAAYNILNAREVEMVLRRIITGAFKRSDGTIDEVARQRAIDGTASDEGGEVTGKPAISASLMR